MKSQSNLIHQIHIFRPRMEIMFYQVPQVTLQQTQANSSVLCRERETKADKNKVKRVRVCMHAVHSLVLKSPYST